MHARALTHANTTCMQQDVTAATLSERTHLPQPERVQLYPLWDVALDLEAHCDGAARWYAPLEALAQVRGRGPHAQPPRAKRLRVEQVVCDADHDVDTVGQGPELQRGTRGVERLAGREPRNRAVHRVEWVPQLRCASKQGGVSRSSPDRKIEYHFARGAPRTS